MWTCRAQQYLSNHFRGVYYATPRNLTEQQLNTERLEALQTEQLQLLNALFVLNTKLHGEIATALRHKKKLSQEELVSFLKQVVLPDAFPRVEASINCA